MAHPDHDPDVGDVVVVPWTAELALRVALGRQGAEGMSREEQLERIASADLPPAAIAALVAAGWDELDPEA